MKTELILKFRFEASHSLFGYEAPHPHIWKLEVAISGTPMNGWLVDLVVLSKSIDSILDGIKDTYLNENEKTNQMVRDYPTCESLSPFFLERVQNLLIHDFHSKNPTLTVSYVLISIHSMDGQELGAVKVTT